MQHSSASVGKVSHLIFIFLSPDLFGVIAAWRTGPPLWAGTESRCGASRNSVLIVLFEGPHVAASSLKPSAQTASKARPECQQITCCRCRKGRSRRPDCADKAVFTADSVVSAARGGLEREILQHYYKNAHETCTYPGCTRQICTVTIQHRSRASFSIKNNKSRELVMTAQVSSKWTSSMDATQNEVLAEVCLLYTSPSPRDLSTSRMPSSA